MLWVIGASVLTSTIVSLIAAKIAVTKHLWVVDDYLHRCTHDLMESVLSVISKDSKR